MRVMEKSQKYFPVLTPNPGFQVIFVRGGPPGTVCVLILTVCVIQKSPGWK